LDAASSNGLHTKIAAGDWKQDGNNSFAICREEKFWEGGGAGNEELMSLAGEKHLHKNRGKKEKILAKGGSL